MISRRPAAAVVMLALATAGCGSVPDAGRTTSAAAESAPTSAATSTATDSGSPERASGHGAATASTGAAGFPSQLAPLMPGMETLGSNVEASGALTAVSLTAATDSAAQTVMDFYQKHFAKLGFEPLARTQTAPAVTQDFVRGAEPETANVTVVQDAGRSVVTVGVHVLPKAAQ
jgi:hypothetical protein